MIKILNDSASAHIFNKGWGTDMVTQFTIGLGLFDVALIVYLVINYG